MKLKELPVSFYQSLLLRYCRKQETRDVCPVIVSLTSIPSRLPTLDIVISSLLSQKKSPEHIILWVNKELEGKLPVCLTRLQDDTFQIYYCEGTTSYRKLLPTIKLFPSSTIVTCDDDVIYPSNWLGDFYKGHQEKPGFVLSQVGRLISRNTTKELKSYNEWLFVKERCLDDNLLPIGYGGVLYPPNTFSNSVFDEKIYSKLCPRADDLWFKAMAYLNGKQNYCISEQAKPIPIIGTQKIALGKSNIRLNGNRDQWNALCEYFPKLKELG